ncbi:MAG: NAD+ synthase [Gemmatimonadota bacterium]|nr:MAG: NAD+ synthase [Gemmatimonadota bacterium]
MKVRVAIAQIRPTKADYAANLEGVRSVLAGVAEWEQPPDLVVFPESIMSGYFLEGGVREVAITAGTLFNDLRSLFPSSGAPPLDVAIGFYEEFRHRYYNSALYASLGDPAEIRHVHRKVFLPTYGLFDEQRFVEKGSTVKAFDTSWGRAALLVCEDAWHSITGTIAALDGAQVLIVPSAAPARGVAPVKGSPAEYQSRPASATRWERLLQNMAEEHGVFTILAQLVGFEGGKGFQGCSCAVAPNGEVLARGPAFEEAIVQADLELDAITRARADQPLLGDLETQLLNLLRSLDSPGPPVSYDTSAAASQHDANTRPVELPVAVPEADDDPMAIDAELSARWLTAFLKDEVVRRRGFKTGIVGLSGGVDSSLTAALAARALGPENVIGVRMPYRTSSPESLHHAELLATSLGIRMETIDITAAVDGYIEAADPEAGPQRRGNVMARMRMVTLFDLSAKYNALPLGTGNKTERLLGYFTWHADDSPPVNPLGDLFKTQVWQLARHVGIPEQILSKPASADLIQGQTDEADLGISYDKADRILHWLLKGLRQQQVIALGFDEAEIELVHQRLHSTHWKRRLPTVAMVSGTAIGESYLRPVDY